MRLCVCVDLVIDECGGLQEEGPMLPLHCYFLLCGEQKFPRRKLRFFELPYTCTFARLVSTPRMRVLDFPEAACLDYSH